MTIIHHPRSEFWQGIYPNGMTEDDINHELADLEFLAGEVPKVYYHITGTMVSKPMTHASVVNALYDAAQDDRYMEAWQEGRKDTLRHVLEFIPKDRPYRSVCTTWDHGQVKTFEQELVAAIRKQFQEDLK